jgi:hypothetical protein
MPIRFPEEKEKTRRTEGRSAKAADATGQAAPPGPSRLALLIGNGRVRNQRGDGYALNIPGSDKDLEALGGVLGDSECAGFEVRPLLEPTMIDLRREIARVAGDAGPDDTLVIYYSGTSTLGADRSLYLPSIDSDVQFLEATCLESDYVLSCLRRSRCRRQLVIMDGCYSGAFFTHNRGIPDGFCAIMGCGPDEICYCDSNGGFFTRLLVEGLRGGAADLDGDGIVTADELFRYVLPRAKALPDPTTPQMWSWNLPEPIPLVHIRQRVFLSYRRANAAAADVLSRRLERDGYGVWVDRSDIGGGTKWRGEIEKGLTDAAAVILLLSKPALESDEIYKEVARALELGKPIIPLSVEPVDLHGWYKDKLGAIQHIEMPPDGADGEWYGRLRAALRHARRSGSVLRA